MNLTPGAIIKAMRCGRLRNHKTDPHKPFWPLNWEDVAGYTFAAVSLFIAAGGGIGGGGILVPLFILVLGTALPIICLFAGSLFIAPHEFICTLI